MRFKTIILAILIPVITAVILVNSVYSREGMRIPIAVVDEDHTGFSKFLIDGITKNNALEVKLTDRESAEKMVSSNSLETAFIILQGFEKRIKNEEFKGLITMVKNPGSISAELIGESIASSAVKLFCASAASNKVVFEYSMISKLSEEEKEKIWFEAWEHTKDQWNQPEPLMKVDIVKINTINKKDKLQMPRGSRIVIGIISAFLVFFLLQGAWWLSDDERNGTICRIKISRASSFDLIAGNILFLFFIGLMSAVIYMLIFNTVFGININFTVYLLISISCYIFFISSMVFIFSSLFSAVQLGFFIPAFSLFTAFAGGCFWDTSMLDNSIKLISLFTPQGWFLRIIDEPGTFMTINMLFVIAGIVFIIFSYLRITNRQHTL